MRDVSGSYAGLRVVANALKRVFLRAFLAHLEEAGAPVGRQGQPLQDPKIPKIHCSIWTSRDKETSQLEVPGGLGTISELISHTDETSPSPFC